ncbi:MULTISPECIES: 2Fe-2S iron-sulfur cluster-binding protein [Brevibacterium]|nr:MULTISPECIES: 2Fe-2S iron-sulfur cluster-binding protein [Brevibacterium]
MRIAELHRFPVKGFPAERIDSADIRRGRGIVGDRAAALTNGSVDVPDGSWQRYSAFTVLKNDTGLQGWQVSASPASAEPAAAAVTITLTAPDGTATTFRTDDAGRRAASARFLSDRIRAQGPCRRRLVAAEQGMFDSRSAGISIINPATVAALGGDLDPLRFRGNVLVEGLAPFAEFGLIGTIVRLGEARVAITESIERCPATTVDPATAEVDVNVPRILAATCGHLHCGVYGRILDSGIARTGDAIEIEGEAPAELIAGDRTPRMMSVVERTTVGDGIVEIVLRDELGWIGGHDEPGTNLRVHLDRDGPFWRTYTITEVAGDVVRIAVRVLGRGSRTVTGLEVGERILVSGPHGTMTAARVFEGTTALVTAGIGITPGLALLRGAVPPAADRIRLIHVDRGGRTGRLWDRVLDRARGLGRIAVEARLHDTARSGRPSRADLVEWLRGCDSALVCGPAGFTRTVLAAAAEAGVRRIHRETFASPSPDLSEAVARYGPAEVTLEDSGTSFVWEPEQGTLLDALEARGVPASSSCRGGSCGTCALPLRAGGVDYPVEPVARAAADEVLACSAVPAGPIRLGI